MIPRALLLFVLVSVVATLTGNAVAQTITVNDKTVGRREDHSEDVGPTNINYEDCIADDFFGVKVTLTSVPGAPSLHVFAGTDVNCGTQSMRPNLENLCWEVFTSATVPTTQINIPVRDIIPHSGDTGTAMDCEAGSTSSFTLHFTLFEGDQQIATVTPATIAGKYDLKGPAAPKVTGIGIGDTRLYPTWEASKEDPYGYRVYCEQTGLSIDNAGTSCVAPTLKAKEKPPADLAVSASATQLAGEAEVKNLTNRQQYACAVGTIDQLQNVGVLSDIVCGVPQPLYGYFKLYRNAGGQGGGGHCAFGRGASAMSATLAALGISAVFFAARRRRRGRRGGAQ